MQTLHARRKWQKISPNLEKDDVVLVKDEDVPHNVALWMRAGGTTDLFDP